MDLKPGANTVEARGVYNGKELTDKITWTYKPGAPKEVHSVPVADNLSLPKPAR